VRGRDDPGGVAVEVRRGDVFIADLDPVVGSEQGGVRPVLVIQNDVGNHHSPTVIVAAITSRLQKAPLPTHVALPGQDFGLQRTSVILLEQIRTIDKRRLGQRLAHLAGSVMRRVDWALLTSVGLSAPDPSCIMGGVRARSKGVHACGRSSASPAGTPWNPRPRP
jgi:mRNA interferase MazF